MVLSTATGFLSKGPPVLLLLKGSTRNLHSTILEYIKNRLGSLKRFRRLKMSIALVRAKVDSDLYASILSL